MISVSGRLDMISQRWPRPIRRDLQRYMRRLSRGTGGSGPCVNRSQSQPYWSLFPTWLAGKYNLKKADTISESVLDEILWAQHCVFLSLRIKDDLLDGQGITSLLFLAADQFLAEAGDILFRHLRQSKRFWDIYTGNLRETVQAFWEVDAMQQRRRVSLRQMRAGYARVSSIFKIGSAAICCLADRERDFSSVEEAADELAIAGQIFDDFRDIHEDLRRGRLNYAARFILGSSTQAGTDPANAVNLIGERLLYSGRVAGLFDEVIGHVETARRTLAPHKLPEAECYFSEYVKSLKTTAIALDHEQRRRTFGVADTPGAENDLKTP